MSLLPINISSGSNLSSTVDNSNAFHLQYDSVTATVTRQIPIASSGANIIPSQVVEIDMAKIDDLIQAINYDFELQREILISQFQSIVSDYQETSDVLAANTWQIFNNNPIWKTVKSLSARKLFEKFRAEYFTAKIFPSISLVTETLSNSEIKLSGDNGEITKRDTTHLEKSLIAVSAFSAVVFANTFLGCFFSPGTILISYGISVLQCFAGIGLSSSLFIITWVMFVATLQYSYEIFKSFSTDNVVKREENTAIKNYEWNQLLSESHYVFNKIFGPIFKVEKIIKESNIDSENTVHEFQIVFSNDLKRCDLFHDIKFGMKIDSRGTINLNALFISHDNRISSSEDITKSPYRSIFESSEALTNKVDTKRLIPHNSALKVIASFQPDKIISDPSAFSFTRVSSFFIKNTINIVFEAATDLGRHGFKFNPLKYIVKFGDALDQFHDSLKARMEVTSNFELFE